MEAANLDRGSMDDIRIVKLSFKDCQQLVSGLDESDPRLWVCRYTHTVKKWVLSIATHGEPGTNQYSLGGFRIAPADRASVPGYNNDSEAINLALGMEKKVKWSRLARVAGPNGFKHLDQIVGGKCVLLPDEAARIGFPRDFELLDFAIQCLQHFRETYQIRINTGQDLGHGQMSNGSISSLEYLHKYFEGSVLSDTSKPTGEGNYFALLGVLEALDIMPQQAHIGLIGCGNIGSHILDKLIAANASVQILEASVRKREELERRGLEVFSPDQKPDFLALPLDALVVNANGGSLDSMAVSNICKNPRIRAITGCENLVMPDKHDEKSLLAARKIFCPTEYCGMMGYLTAVEEYISRSLGHEFSISIMLEAARGIQANARASAKRVIKSDFSISFANAVEIEARS